MPRLPTYTARVRPSGQATEAPISTRAAATGEGAIGRGIAAAGAGVANYGEALARIKIEQIALSDTINSSKMAALHRASELDFANTLSQTDLSFDDSGQSTWETAGEQSWQDFTEKSKELSFSRKGQLRMNAQMEIWQTVRASQLRAKQTNSLVSEARAAVPLAVEEAIASGVQVDIDTALSNFEKGKERLWGGRDDLANKALTDAIVAGYKNRATLDPAGTKALLEAELKAKKQGKSTNELLKILKAAEVDDIIDFARTEIAQNKVEANVELVAKQKETARRFLLELWDGTLTQPELEKATEANLLTYERAKDLRNALVTPKVFDLNAYIKVKNAVNAHERGAVDFDDALDVLTSNAHLVGDSGKALTDKLFAVPNKNEADWEKESLNYIESQILDRDLLTGILYGTPVQQTKALEARLAYDVALEEAERKGEPVLGRDKLLKAHEIMLKYRPSTAEKAAAEPPAKLKEGLGTVPFISPDDVRKAIKQAKENLGDKASPEDIKTETLRLLGE